MRTLLGHLVTLGLGFVGAAAGMLCTQAFHQEDELKVHQEQASALVRPSREGSPTRPSIFDARPVPVTISDDAQEETEDDVQHDLAEIEVDRPEESHAERRERVAREANSYREMFLSEDVDRTWSRSAETNFEENLLSMSDASFTLDRFECRTSVCLGELSWETDADAVRDAQRIAEQPYKENCKTSVFMPELAVGQGLPTAGQLVFDCTDWRADNF